MVGFCGGGGTPLFTATEADFEVAWFSPQSEYRPTQYLQSWVRFWFDDACRLQAAKLLQKARLRRIHEMWIERDLFGEGHPRGLARELPALIEHSGRMCERAPTVDALLLEEARLSKQLSRLASHAVRYGDFTRAKDGIGADPANRLLDHGNYLAYGLAASATWVLGLPHALALMHGKTRRGALVFDVADLVKDATILPLAFISAARGDDDQEFRRKAIEALTQSEALDFMIKTLQTIAAEVHP